MSQSGNPKRLRIAIAGGGISGLVCAHILQRAHDVSLFERNAYIGGHTNTRIIERGPDAGVAVDTGFIVLNDKNYANFHRFLSQLEVPVRWSNMSFGYYDEKSRLAYAGTTLSGMFAERKNLFSLGFWRFLLGIAQFCRRAEKDLSNGGLEGLTLGEYLNVIKLHRNTVTHYLTPMGAAIWSSPRDQILDFPALQFVRFFRNHGLLSVNDRPRWQTVAGGSHSYIKAFLQKFKGTAVSECEVSKVARRVDGVDVLLSTGETKPFDKIIFASHADETLRMLAAASPDEVRLLSAWRYEKNRTVLHSDSSVLPPNRRAWASWNFRRRREQGSDSPVSVSYHMNRLQGLQTKNEFIVTLNGAGIRDEFVHYEVEYQHPVFDIKSMNTQTELPNLNGKHHSYFCGAYFGYGFHEDGVKSALAVCNEFGLAL